MTQNQRWVLFTYVATMVAPAYIMSIVIAASDLLYETGKIENAVNTDNLAYVAVVTTSLACLAISLILLKGEMKESIKERGIITSQHFGIAILGVFLLFGAQTVATIIEQAIGLPLESENTQYITEMIVSYPFYLILPVIYAPILEEIIFRKFLFGSVNRKLGLIWAYIISSLVFGLVHFDLPHLLTYFSMGIVLAFLYHKTDRIIVPMIAHGGMNFVVLLIQLSYI